MTNAQVFAALKTLNPATTASREFMQSDYLGLKDVTAKVGTKVAGGMCNGLCHDWVRRVLQGGKMEFGPKKLDVKETKAAVRSAIGQALILNLNETAFEKQGQKMLGTAFDNLVKQTDKLIPLKLSPAIEGILTTGGYLNKGLARNGRYQWKDVYNALAEANGDNGVTVQSTWQMQGAAWDAMWTKVRKTASPHPFQNISRIKNEKYQTFSDVYEGIKAPMQEMVAGNMAVIIGFHTRGHGTDGGHAVAVHRTVAGQYGFYDPNFGNLEYKSFVHAATALVFVIRHAYPAAGWQPIRQDGRFDSSWETFVPRGGWTKAPNCPPQLSLPKVKERVLSVAEGLVPKVKDGKGTSKVF